MPRTAHHSLCLRVLRRLHVLKHLQGLCHPAAAPIGVDERGEGKVIGSLSLQQHVHEHHRGGFRLLLARQEGDERVVELVVGAKPRLALRPLEDL